jgi:hypothetical protein
MAPTVYVLEEPNMERALPFLATKYVERALTLSRNTYCGKSLNSSNENEPLDLIGWHPRVYIYWDPGGKCLSFHVFHIAMHYTLYYSS